MLSILQEAQQHVNAAIHQQAQGLALFMPSKWFNRAEFAAWVIVRAMAKLPSDEFRALYIGQDQVILDKTREQFDTYLRTRQFKDEGIYTVKDNCLPDLRSVNYATVDTMVAVSDRFPTANLTLLIVDERVPGSTNALLQLVERGKPTFVVAMAKVIPWPNWAWRYLGEPTVVRGPASKGEPAKAES